MYIAIASYQNRVASVLESSEKFIVVQPPFYDINKSTSISVLSNSPHELSRQLLENNISVLICGAVSGCTRQIIESNNIQVIPWITGSIENIIQAYKNGNLLASSNFLMPGCRNRGLNKRIRCRKGHHNFD